MSSRQGQAGILILVGVIVVVIVVVAATLVPNLTPEPPIPVAIQQDQKVVKDFVENMLSDKTYETITLLEKNGGYLDAELNAVQTTSFLHSKVPYWQRCETPMVLTRTAIAQKLGTIVENELKTNLQGMSEINGKEVEFDVDTTQAAVNILDNRVDIIVDLITTVKGYRIREPYTVSVPTTFGRIIDFASDFSREEADTRFFETFTILDIEAFSDLPRVGYLTECGDSIYMSPLEVANRLEGIVMDIIVNTKMWDDTIIQGGIPVQYGIPEVYNKHTYEDLETEEGIRFFMPDGFSITTFNPVIILNLERLVQVKYLPDPNVCWGFYDQKYSAAYPIIIRVYDSILNSYFNFANFAYVDGTEPGSCDSMSLATTCSDMQCSARVIVNDGYGKPFPGTSVYMGGCLVGTTDDFGEVDAPAPCGTYNLVIFNSTEYEFVNKEVTNNGNYYEMFTLNRLPKLTFNIVQSPPTCGYDYVDNEMLFLTIASDKLEEDFLLVNNQIVNVDSCMASSGANAYCDTCTEDSTNINACNECLIRSSGCLESVITPTVNIDYIPAGDYKMSGIIMNMKMINTYSSTYPFIATPLVLSETKLKIPQEDSTINIRVPESDKIYNYAIDTYNTRKDDKRCICGDCELACCPCIGGPDKETDEMAEAAALVDATNYIRVERSISVEACS